MINEADEPSSACRLWRTYQVETSTPPSGSHNMAYSHQSVKSGCGRLRALHPRARKLLRQGHLPKE